MFFGRPLQKCWGLFFYLKKVCVFKKDCLSLHMIEQEELYDTIVELRITVLELQEDLRQAKEQLILRQ